MNGEISVESLQGQGTEFIIKLKSLCKIDEASIIDQNKKFETQSVNSYSFMDSDIESPGGAFTPGSSF